MKIGLIAGGGQFPVLFSKKAALNGYQVFSIGFNGEADKDLKHHVYDFQWLYLGQVSKLIKYFKQNGVDQVVMLGSIKKVSVFKNVRPDLKALSFIAKNVRTHDDTVLTAFADLLLEEGIKILPSTFLLPELLSPKGCWTKRKPDKGELEDIAYGWKMATEIGRLDIGQCVVVGNGSVLAVEAIDGTDETIKRGGRLSHKNGAVVVKRSKPNQDLRFDLPSSGCETIEIMHQSDVRVLILEAKKSLSFDREEMIKLADQYHISILGYTDDDFQ